MPENSFQLADNMNGGKTWWLGGWEPKDGAIAELRERAEEFDSNLIADKADAVNLSVRLLRLAVFSDLYTDIRKTTSVPERIKAEAEHLPPPRLDCLGSTSAVLRLAEAAGLHYVATANDIHTSGMLNYRGHIVKIDASKGFSSINLIKPKTNEYRNLSGMVEQIVSEPETIGTYFGSEGYRRQVATEVGTVREVSEHALDHGPEQVISLRVAATGEKGVKMLAALTIAHTRKAEGVPEGVSYVHDVRPFTPIFKLPKQGPRCPLPSLPTTLELPE